jgi:serine/threonine protein kinase
MAVVREELVPTELEEELVGKTLADRYEILSLIGEGGMGLVYKAKHTLMNRLVAIKMIRAEYSDDTKLLQRFQQEATAISKLDHPNIVEVYDYGISPEGIPYLVMDYLEGISLSDLLTGEGQMSYERAMPLFLQACHALKHAHENGIIHRDFKASNLVVCKDSIRGEFVKVVDFGMAKLLHPDVDSIGSQELTKSGEVFGSPLYMSPEQCKGQPLDERSDMYSFACVMYYALAGKPPFLGENVLNTLQKQINEVATPPSAYQNAISYDLDAIILKALHKEPHDRYQQVSEMLLDLEAVNNGQQLLSSGAPLPEKLKRRVWTHSLESEIIFATVLGVCIVAMASFMSGRFFESVDETQDMNMWVDRNQDGDRARYKHQLSDAERHYQDAITEAMKFGKNDPRLAKSLLSLGSTYLEDKQYSRAESTLKRALQILDKCYGHNSSEQATALFVLARVYGVQGLKEEEEQTRKHAQEMVESSLEPHSLPQQ